MALARAEAGGQIESAVAAVKEIPTCNIKLAEGMAAAVGAARTVAAQADESLAVFGLDVFALVALILQVFSPLDIAAYMD